MPLIESEKQKLKEQNDEATNILDVALSSGAFSDEGLADQVTTFLAGHETTASALVWAIYLLCKHPKVQSKLRKEILVAVPDQNCEAQIVTATIFDDLNYLQAVCNDALRLFPPVAVTVRVAVKDTKILDQLFAKDTTVMPPPWAVNAAHDLWGPDATEFDPER